mmetsp:Transcript_2666/g.5125  ORF Transcript_2666/g.5125 Transcript_2666/m.5125 type:complete len:99 (+) Transcript_2666:970-1266(+)
MPPEAGRNLIDSGGCLDANGGAVEVCGGSLGAATPLFSCHGREDTSCEGNQDVAVLRPPHLISKSCIVQHDRREDRKTLGISRYGPTLETEVAELRTN